MSLTNRASGFSLIEVLVSLLIISAGLLGLAGVQAMSINNTAVARARSIAAEEASGLASMMDSNHQYWGTGAASATTCVNTVSGAVYINQFTGSGTCAATTSSSSGALSGLSKTCLNAYCLPAEMAAADLRTWASNLSASGIPNGYGEIDCTTAVPVSCTVKIYWSEKNVATNVVSGTSSGKLATGSLVTQSYAQVVAP